MTAHDLEIRKSLNQKCRDKQKEKLKKEKLLNVSRLSLRKVHDV